MVAATRQTRVTGRRGLPVTRHESEEELKWQRWQKRKQSSVNGGNGGARIAPAAQVDDLEKAQDIARRYRCEFVDLHNFQLHHDLFKKIPVHLMFRYNFVPLEETETDGWPSPSPIPAS